MTKLGLDLLWRTDHIIDMQHARERLKGWIVRSKLSQGKAADLLEVDRSYLSQILSGKRSPGLETAVHFESVTGVPVATWVAKAMGGQSEPTTGPAGNRSVGRE